MQAGVLGCDTGILPTLYSGLVLGAKKSSMEIWNGVIEKFEKRLPRWKAHYLSLGNRIIMKNSILDALLTDAMSLFSLPAKAAKRLDSLRRNFLLQRHQDASFSWVKICKSSKKEAWGQKLQIAQQESIMKVAMEIIQKTVPRVIG